MSDIGLNSAQFRQLAGQILAAGHTLRFQASGDSMQPFIHDGDILTASPVDAKQLCNGDVLLVDTASERLVAHRLVKARQFAGDTQYLIKADSTQSPDGWFPFSSILGRVQTLERGQGSVCLVSAPQRWRARLWVLLNPWLSGFSWLPAWFRRLVWRWFLAY